MRARPPLDALTVPVRERVRWAPRGARAWLRYAAVIAVLPAQASAKDFDALPFAATLRAFHRQKPRRGGDVLGIKIGERAETLMVLAYTDPRYGSFEHLQWAQKCAQAALQVEPALVLVWTRIETSEAQALALNALVAALEAGAFALPAFKSKPKRRARLRSIEVAGGGKTAGLKTTVATAAGNNLARWLTALPPNELNASRYRRFLREFADATGVRFKFYGERALRRLGAGAFLAVSQGNQTRDAGIALLRYRPRTRRQPSLALVGKGICFDTGGTNLKSHKGMLDMHIDMAGSAAALGSLLALKLMGASFAVDCWLAITENRIGPTAYQPQDVVRALNGTSIQVIHTDAEGRMVLADTLALAAREKPRAIIDYATLTGACVSALTERYAGAFTNRPQLRARIEAAGTRSGERVWCFPMDADFEADLDSAVADVLQCAVEGKGDHILAALFLKRFVPQDIPWLHLDLAAAMRRGGLAHVGTDVTGFGVRYTVELLRQGWPPARQP